jgi:hypothetical protein
VRGRRHRPSVPPKQDWTTAATPSGIVATQPPAGSAEIGGAPVAEVKPSTAALSATLGVQVFWNSAGSQASMAADANRIFNYVVGLGANSVGVDFWFFTDGPTPTRVYGVPGRTPSPATIAMVVKIAREHGLRVLVRPLLNEDNIKIYGEASRAGVEAKYGRDELWKAIGPGHDEAWEYGYISGKLATLRWVLGSEWDFLDL